MPTWVAYVFSMQWLLWWQAAFLATGAIAVIEYLNRTANYQSFGDAVFHTLPWIAISQLGLFYCWRDAPTFMIAWATFTVSNSVVRLFNAQFFVGESLSLYTIAGVSVMFLGTYLIKLGSA